MYNSVKISQMQYPFETLVLRVIRRFIKQDDSSMVSYKMMHVVRCKHGYLLNERNELIDVWNHTGGGYLNGRLCRFQLIK